MERKWLAIPADRKPTRVVRLCVLLGLTALTVLVAVPGVQAMIAAPPAAVSTE